MEENQKKLIFSGIQPTGTFTLGNYMGAIQNWGKLQDDYRCI
ncbi:MAG: tryptophan--tRNA ligase, partial [Ruminococcus sp.]|nr:tryptophan--tRNA ligase [Ruminococcus sp.]